MTRRICAPFLRTFAQRECRRRTPYLHFVRAAGKFLFGALIMTKCGL